MPPTFGWQALAWKISQHPKYWLPFIGIVIAVAVTLYFLLPAIYKSPMPDATEVKDLFISWDMSEKESSFKKITQPDAYSMLCQCLVGSFRSLKKPGDDLIATLRIDTTSGTPVYLKFYDSTLITINGECYDRARPFMFLQMVESTRYDSGY